MCQVQQFQRHQNTFVLSYDITISIFLLLAYCFITIKLYQIDGQHIDGGGGGIIAMAWVALVETVIDMRVSMLYTNLLTLNVMTLMAKYHKKTNTDLNHPSSLVWL